MYRIKELLRQEKIQKQIYKLLLTLIVCLFFLLVVELIFKIPAVSNFFGPDSLNKGNSVTVWIILWLLMFAQVTIIPMPAMPIFAFCVNTTLVSYELGFLGLFSLRTLFFVVYVTSACLAGAVCAYLLGRFGGKKAVKWIAGDEEDYNEWCKKLNCKAGKQIYAATVLLPIFPDDIICIVVGSMKMDFKFYVIINALFRFIGSYCILLFMRMPYINNFFSSAVNGGFPWALLAYSILFILSIVAAILWRCKVIKKSY